MQDKKNKPRDRRDFLRALGGATTVAAAAVATAGGVVPGEAQAYEPGEEERKGRYRETEHVKAFYRTNGYETLKK